MNTNNSDYGLNNSRQPLRIHGNGGRQKGFNKKSPKRFHN